MPRVATYVLHKDIDPLAGKSKLLGVFIAYISAIYIAIHPAQRFKGFQLIGNSRRAKVARMPYLIAISKVREDSVIKVVVGIGYKAYAGHCNDFAVA